MLLKIIYIKITMLSSIENFAELYKKYVFVPVYIILTSIYWFGEILNKQIDRELRLIHDVESI